MAIQYINTGSGANAGNGDSLRSAFIKVNNNFAYLSTASFGGGGNGYTGSIGYTGSQGNIGYTGSAGQGIVNNGDRYRLSYYANSGTTLSASTGVIFIPGAPGSPFPELQVGETSTSTIFKIVRNAYSTNSNPSGGFIYAQHHETADASNFNLYRTRGNSNSPTNLQNGDDIADITFNGYYNGASSGAAISVTVEGTPNTTGFVPAKISFGASNGSSFSYGAELSSSSTWKINKLSHLDTTATSIVVSTSLIPESNITYDLGSTSSQWRSLYVSSSTIYIDNKALSIDANNNITINGEIATGGYTGSRGYTGSKGYTGSSGIQGYSGSQGELGYTGSKGDLGYTGSRGDTGYAGSQGDIGYAGSQGTNGLQGNRGYTGSEGAQGSPGQQGQTGAQGVSVTLVGSTSTSAGLPLTGNAGDGWIVNDTGNLWFWSTVNSQWEDIGQIVGPQGDLGYTGSQGTQGDIGLTGDQGYTGSQGDVGYVGSQGDVGYVGSQGELGYVGSQGDVGYVGSQGETGYTGSQANIGNFVFTDDQLSVSDDGDITVVTNANTWTFGASGVITFPNGQTIDGATGDESIQIGGTSTWISIDNNGAPPGFVVATAVGGAEHRWTFADDGFITLPGGAQITTAGSGADLVAGPGGWAELASNNGSNFVWVNDSGAFIVTDSTSTGKQWIFGLDGNLTAPGHLLPNADLAYDLGSTTTQWRSIYVGTGTIYIGGVALGVNQDNYVTVDGNPIITVNTAGNITIQGDSVLTPVTVSAFAPPADVEGNLWYNNLDGRTYVAYSGTWVDANPTVVPTPETYLGNIAIDGSTLNINGSTLTINTSGTLLVNGSEVSGSGYGATLTASATDPMTSTGTLWFNTVEGRTYLKYNDQWVDVNPTVVPPPSTYLDEITIDGSTINMNGGTLAISNTGTLLVNGSPVTGSGGGITVSDGSSTTVSGVANMYITALIEDIGDGDVGIVINKLTRNNHTVELNADGELVGGTGTDVTVIATTGTNTATWTFSANSSLTVPGPIISEGYQLALAGSQSSYDIGRYLLVRDGDYPSHLHLDTPDNATYDIYIGDDSRYVKVDHTGPVVIGTNLNTWTFAADGGLVFPDATVQTTAFTGTVAVQVAELVGDGAVAQVGSSLVIATDSGGGLGGWSSTAASIAYDANIPSTYAVGSTITWQDGTTATLVQVDDYGPTYIDIFWDTPKTGTLFPITLKTANYVAAVPPTARIVVTTGTNTSTWTFGTDGVLTLPVSGDIVDSNGTSVLGGGSFNTGTLVAEAVTATYAAYAFGFNTGTLVAQAVLATTATNAGYAYSFNTGTLVATAVTAGTVTTAAQPNITSVGTLTGLSVNGTIYNNGWELSTASSFSTSTLVRAAVSATTAISLLNGGNTLRPVAVPGNLAGAAGDTVGDIANDGSYLYYCSVSSTQTNYIGYTYGGASAAKFVSIVKSTYEGPSAPVAGMIVTHRGVSHTITSVTDQSTYWQLNYNTSESASDWSNGETVTVTTAPAVGNIWKTVPWNAITTSTTSTVSITNTASATTTATGALRVVGGVGVGGNLYANTVYSHDGYFRGPTGNGSILLSSGGTVYLSSDLVLNGASSIIKGPAGYSVMTIGSPSGAGNSGVKFLGTATVAGTTDSTSSSTGALIVSGGASIAKNAYVGGYVVQQAKPAFRVVGNGGSVSSGTTITSAHWTMDYNQGNHLNTSTGVFTAPVTGIYQVNLVMRTNSNVNPTINQAIVIKNTSTVLTMLEFGVNTTMNHAGVSTAARLVAGDTVTVTVAVGTMSFDANDNWSIAFLG